MNDFDETMNNNGQGQAANEAVSQATAQDGPVTVDATSIAREVDDQLVDDIMSQITGGDKQDEPSDAENPAGSSEPDGLDVAPEATMIADSPATEEAAPAIDVLSSSQMDSNAPSPFATPAAQAAQASLLDVPGQEAPKKRRVGLIIALALLLALVGAYVAGSMYFSRVFMPGTTINGEDVSLKSVEEVAKANSDSVESFELNVSGDGVNLQVKAKDIAAAIDGNNFANKAMEQQNAWGWPLAIMGRRNYRIESNLSYDTARLDDLVGSNVDAVNANATDPVNATTKYDSAKQRYEIVPEVMGTKIDRAAVLELVHNAISNRQKTVELGDSVLLKPTVLSTDEALNAGVNQANQMLGCVLDFDYNGQSLHTLGAGDLEKWIRLNDDMTVSFDQDACTTWCRGALSVRLDSVGSSRTFTTPDGREIHVSGGTYGWSIDGGELSNRIAEHVRAGQSGHIELPWLKTANSWNPGGNEWGDTYIEIDLGAQHVRYWRDGNIAWESDCVSGGMNSGKMHYTPTGVYYINDNMQSGNVELKGEIDPVTKQPEYISYVKYWMPFIDNSHALHDADWRSSFGGDIYTYSGSHGCVNLPPDAAAELYNMISVGTVVVVHD